MKWREWEQHYWRAIVDERREKAKQSGAEPEINRKPISTKRDDYGMKGVRGGTPTLFKEPK